MPLDRRKILGGPLTPVVLAASSETIEVDLTDRLDRLVGRITNYDVLANGTLTALNTTVELNTTGLSTVGFGLSGTWVGTVVAEVNVGDGVWDVIPLVNNTTGAAALSTTANGNFILGIAGWLGLRIRMSLYTSGTATVYLEGTSASSGVILTRSIPTGVNSIGSVDIDNLITNPVLVANRDTPFPIAVTPTITAGAYVANDAVGGLLTFANAALAAGRGGVITKVVITDDAGQSVPYELHLFDQTFTAMADNAPWSPSDADMLNWEGYIDIAATDQAAGAANSGAAKSTGLRCPFPYYCVGTSLFGQLVTRGAPTYAATDDIRIKIYVERR